MWSLPALKELNETAFLLATGGGNEADALAICTRPDYQEIRVTARTYRKILRLAQLLLKDENA